MSLAIEKMLDGMGVAVRRDGRVPTILGGWSFGWWLGEWWGVAFGSRNPGLDLAEFLVWVRGVGMWMPFLCLAVRGLDSSRLGRKFVGAGCRSCLLFLGLCVLEVGLAGHGIDIGLDLWGRRVGGNRLGGGSLVALGCLVSTTWYWDHRCWDDKHRNLVGLRGTPNHKLIKRIQWNHALRVNYPGGKSEVKDEEMVLSS